MMDIDILSLFPDYFVGPFEESIIKRARQKGIIDIRHIFLRDFATGKHRRVDDRPFGGGPGMVLMPEPITQAIRSVRRPESHVIYLSPQGTLLTTDRCKKLATQKHLILLCGNYEGIDERVIQQEVDEEISIGDYVLTNGQLPAIVLVDAVVRLIDGVLGNKDSAAEDSFQNGIFDAPQYTQPVEFEGEGVPEVLLKGDHKKVASWRRQAAIEKTRLNRPDLYLNFLADSLESENEFEGNFEFTLPVKNIEKSVNFFRKQLGLNILNKSESRAALAAGGSKMHLVEASHANEIKNPLLQLTIKEQEKFYQIASRIVQSGQEIGNLECKPTKQQLVFTDLDGYCWVLVHRLEEITK